MGKALALLIAIAFTAMCFAMIFVGPAKRQPKPPKVEACENAQTAIWQKLSDPKLARFSDCDKAADSVQMTEPERFLVIDEFEYPDAQGIYRSHSYKVSVSKRGDDWFFTVLSLR